MSEAPGDEFFDGDRYRDRFGGAVLRWTVD